MATKHRTKKAISITFSALLVLVSRALFLCHGTLVAWRVTDVYDSPWFWAIGTVLVFAFIEIYWVIIKRKAKEWTWFSIPVALYLICVVPGVWLLRLKQVTMYRESLGMERKVETNGTVNNRTLGSELQALSSQFGLTIPVKLDARTWTDLLDQSLILILIITRWIAPFGRVSHKKLSEVLFVFLGLGSDIVELFVLFEDEYVLMRDHFVYLILGVWTLSLLQFTLPLNGALANSDPKSMDKKPGKCRDCMRNEAWTVLIIVLFQDGPFLFVRLFLMVSGDLVNYNLVFFTVKNILVVMLQFYRFIVLCACVDSKTGESIRRKRKREKEMANRHNNSNSQMSNIPDKSARPQVSEDDIEAESEVPEESETEDEVIKESETHDKSSKKVENGYSNKAFTCDSQENNAV